MTKRFTNAYNFRAISGRRFIKFSGTTLVVEYWHIKKLCFSLFVSGIFYLYGLSCSCYLSYTYLKYLVIHDINKIIDISKATVHEMCDIKIINL